jgi:hypothetical protein
MAENIVDTTTNIKSSWREVLPIHPAAMLLPRMTDTELKELGVDIGANGLQIGVIIRLDENGREELLDGVSRLDAMVLAGIEVVKDGEFNRDQVLHQFVGGNVDPYHFVLSVNLHRRHLTNEQKTELIGKLLDLKSGASDRQIATLTGTSHPTVAKVRREKEAGGKITTSPTRTDKRGRQQPATKPATKPPQAPPVIDVIAVEIDVNENEVAAALPAVEIAPVKPDVSPTHLRKDGVLSRIADLARDCRGLMQHPAQNADEIRKKLSAIIELSDPDPSTKCNARLDRAALPKALGLAA